MKSIRLKTMKKWLNRPKIVLEIAALRVGIVLERSLDITVRCEKSRGNNDIFLSIMTQFQRAQNYTEENE
jgi:hypothetical protein